MRYIHFSLLALIVAIAISCGKPSVWVEVNVQEKFEKRALDSVAVHLYRVVGDSSRLLSTFYTDSDGICKFSFEPQEGCRYRTHAERKHYQETVSDDGGAYENEAWLEIQDSNRISLLLEPILPPDPERFERMHEDIPISQLVAAITADEWSWAFLPKLEWEDIPILLQIGGDSAHVANYPRHPLSTYRPDSARVGLIALWLVEAIRKREIRGLADAGNLMPPSRAPILGTRRGNPSGFNSKKQLKQAWEGYQNWWEQAQELDRAKAVRANPLKGKGMSWM